jgi:methylglutaconyl-CoA hydratase
MDTYQSLQLEQAGALSTVWLNRPERHNAFDQSVIAELQHCLEQLAQQPQVRAVVLAARGASFCAGADLAWMQRQADAVYQDNLEDARSLARLLRTLALMPQPTVARVQGVALGGGLGLIAACDMAIASSDARFGTTEVRLGLTPSTIAPYVIEAIGARAARRYFQTGERFDAPEALRLGLIHEYCDAEALDRQLAALLAALQQGAPLAQAHSKRLIADLQGRNPTDAALLEHTAESIAQVRAGQEARAGIAAFFARRKPPWAP